MAVAALRAEAAATPKPGLVDRENSGAHTDMDYPLFLASCRALESYFVRCAEIGAEASPPDSGAGRSVGSKTAEAGSLQLLREEGLAAEEAMFAATGGVNTHKGLIFSMGVLCFCLGGLLGEGAHFHTLQKRCAEVSARLLCEQMPTNTHGAAVRKNTGIGGIRGEALSGFDSAFSIGYPALKEALDRGFDMNRALVRTLLVLMRRTEDSNAVYRGGRQGLTFMQKQAEEILRETDLNSEEGMERVRTFDRKCTARNLSPGGSADLLALSVMIYTINETDEIGRIER